MIDKQFLIDFETEVKERYEAGEIKAPVHLSSNNEEQLIEIFKDVDKNDWVFSSWRNHYHALLHGIPRDTLMDLIVRGKSMSVYSENPKFYSSAIVGGIIPIALGTAKALKMKQDDTLNKNYYRDKWLEDFSFPLHIKPLKKYILSWLYGNDMNPVLGNPLYDDLKRDRMKDIKKKHPGNTL